MGLPNNNNDDYLLSSFSKVFENVFLAKIKSNKNHNFPYNKLIPICLSKLIFNHPTNDEAEGASLAYPGGAFDKI